MSKKRILQIILILLILVMIWIYFNPGKTRSESNHSSQESDYLYLSKGDLFSEDFICGVNDLNSLVFSFRQDFYKDDNCEVRIKLLSDDKVIVDKKMEYYSILSDTNNYIYFDKIPNSLDKKFTIEVSNTCDKTLAMNFYNSEDSEFFYNGQKMNKGLSFKMVGLTKTNSYLLYPRVAILIVLLIIVMLDEGEKKNAKKSKRKNRKK